MKINIENLTINVYIGDVDVEEVVDASEFTEAVAEAERKLYATAAIEPQAVGPINPSQPAEPDYWDKAVDEAVKEISGVHAFDADGIELEVGDRVYYKGSGTTDLNEAHAGYLGESLLGKSGTIVRVVDNETVLVSYEYWTDGHNGEPEHFSEYAEKNNHWFTRTNNLEWEID